MANLKKPVECGCGSKQFKHIFKPERWVCKQCDRVGAERPSRGDPNHCRVCNAERGTKPFSKWSNICLECKRGYNKTYNVVNKDKISAQHRESYQRDKTKRIAAVRAAVQRSPQAFITHMVGRLKKPSNVRKKRSGKLVSERKLAILNDVQIDRHYMVAMWDYQKGKCAMTGLPMTHQFNDLNAASIDRRDSQLGYIPGNVQLVCQWVNKAKGNHPDTDFKRILIALGKSEILKIHADEPPTPGDPVDALFAIIIRHFADKWWLVNGEITIQGGAEQTMMITLDYLAMGVREIEGAVFADEVYASGTDTHRVRGAEPMGFECELADPDSVEKLLAFLDSWVEARK